MMDRRGENLIRPLMLAIGLHIILYLLFLLQFLQKRKQLRHLLWL